MICNTTHTLLYPTVDKFKLLLNKCVFLMRPIRWSFIIGNTLGSVHTVRLGSVGCFKTVVAYLLLSERKYQSQQSTYYCTPWRVERIKKKRTLSTFPKILTIMNNL